MYRHCSRLLASAVFAELAVVLCAAGRAEPLLVINRRLSGYRTRLRSRIVRNDREHAGSGTIIGCGHILTVHQNVRKFKHLLLIFAV